MSKETDELIALVIRITYAEGMEFAAELIVKEEFDHAKIIAEFIFSQARLVRAGKL